MRSLEQSDAKEMRMAGEQNRDFVNVIIGGLKVKSGSEDGFHMIQ